MATTRPKATELGDKLASRIQGKTILITGPSPDSIAAHLAIVTASHKPNLILLAGRAVTKLNETTKQIKAIAPECPTRNLIVDFASLQSVREAAKEVNEYKVPIDVSILSAGIMAPPYSKTIDGFESSFAVNHLGHFLFVNSIMGKIQAAGQANPDGARIVVVSSDGHAVAGVGENLETINFHDGRSYNPWRSYGQSKTANCLMALSLSDKLASRCNVQSYSLHPGVIMSSNLGNHVSGESWADFLRVRDEMANSLSDARRAASTNTHTKTKQVDAHDLQKTVDEGAATLMVAAFDPSIKHQTGSYLQDAIVDQDACEDHAKDRSEAERLWKISEQCVGQKFGY